MFPPDFFNGMKDNSGFKSDRNGQPSTVFSFENIQKKEESLIGKRVLKVDTQRKVINDFQKEIEEDKELLDMFNGVKLKGNKFL